MSLLLRGLVILLLCLTMFATSAAAECAWVLWKRMDSVLGGKAETTWSPLFSFTSHGACDKAAMQGVTQLYGTKGNEPPTGVLVLPVCFPDTVDPRGAKGR